MKALSKEQLQIEVSSRDLARATRLLVIRSQREATGIFAGNYASAFRGSGIEFEESRPYAAGDDIRSIDWNVTARAGHPFVKRFREERNQTVLFGLDVSASMRFGTTGHAKAATAAHALALVAAAAGRAGDSTGLVCFDSRLRGRVSVGRGMAHTWSLIRFAVAGASRSHGTTRLESGLRALRVQSRQRSTVMLFSDFRDDALLPSQAVGENNAQNTGLRSELTRLARAHDVIAVVLVDPREIELPKVGMIRVEDPERPGASFILNTQSRRARARYRDACAAGRRRVEAEFRRSGVETLQLHTDRSPLYTLGRFFRERANRRSRASA